MNRGMDNSSPMIDHEPLTRKHWLVLAGAYLGWMFDGVEMGLFPLVARPALQDLLRVTDDCRNEVCAVL